MNNNAVSNVEDLGIPKSTMQEFFDDLRGRLAFISGLLDYDDFGLTLADVRKPVLVIGKPGIGKTCGVMSILSEINHSLPAEKQFGFKKILLGQTVVGTLSGVPVANNSTGEIRRAQAPELPVAEKDGEYGILFLDEITTADEAQVQPALGLCDDSRNIGEYTLPEHWLVVAAGNGPDCSNFIRLDDMTLSRFSPYDINYSYTRDWRGWAHEHNINPLIIAYLNFKPENCVSVESSDMDDAGKMFPCPRTWERLSIELKMREAIGRPVKSSELSNFAGRIIGKRVGREFASFSEFNDSLHFSPEAIVEGSEKAPDPSLRAEEFHILLQSCVSILKEILGDNGDGQGNYNRVAYQSMANVLDWFLGMERFQLGLCVDAVAEFRSSIPNFSDIVCDEDFPQFTNSFNDFVMNHVDLILEAERGELKEID